MSIVSGAGERWMPGASPPAVIVRRRLPVLLLVLFGAPCSAQIDIANMWRPLPHNQDGSGMVGDAAGVPVSQDGRFRAQSWSPEEYDVAEWVCRPHAWDYSLEGPLAQVRFSADYDRDTQQVAAYRGHIYMQWQQQTIWMDGRPHPPRNAPHTWSGFTTGRWEGDVLVTTTTHLKEAYIRRWGLMRSDRTTVTTRWRRIGDYLQATVIMYDPVYLTEPYIRSSPYRALHPQFVDLDQGPRRCRWIPIRVKRPPKTVSAPAARCRISYPAKAACRRLIPSGPMRSAPPMKRGLGGAGDPVSRSTSTGC